MSTEELAGLKGIGIEGSIMADNDIRIAVIGGSTFDRSFCGDRPFAEGLAKVEGRFRAGTGAGQSPTIHRMRYGEVPFFFVPFHGVSDFSARENFAGLNFVTLWAALFELGVTHAIGGATGGGSMGDRSGGR